MFLPKNKVPQMSLKSSIAIVFAFAAAFVTGGSARAGAKGEATSASAKPMACFPSPPKVRHGIVVTCNPPAQAVAAVDTLLVRSKDVAKREKGDSSDAFYFFLDALKVVRTCMEAVPFSDQVFNDLQFLSSAYALEIVAKQFSGRDCSKEIATFTAVIGNPPQSR